MAIRTEDVYRPLELVVHSQTCQTVWLHTSRGGSDPDTTVETQVKHTPKTDIDEHITLGVRYYQMVNLQSEVDKDHPRMTTDVLTWFLSPQQAKELHTQLGDALKSAGIE